MHDIFRKAKIMLLHDDILRRPVGVCGFTSAPGRAILWGMKTLLTYTALFLLSFTTHGAHVEAPHRTERVSIRRHHMELA